MRGPRVFLRGDKSIVATTLMVIGLGVMVHASSYDLGTLRRMGPGYFPFLLGAAICVIALLIYLEAPTPKSVDDVGPAGNLLSKLRAFGCVTGGILLFLLLIRTAGFIPATAACVLLSGMGEPENSLRDLIFLAIAVTIFATLVFVIGLGIPVRLVNI